MSSQDPKPFQPDVPPEGPMEVEAMEAESLLNDAGSASKRGIYLGILVGILAVVVVAVVLM